MKHPEGSSAKVIVPTYIKASGSSSHLKPDSLVQLTVEMQEGVIPFTVSWLHPVPLCFIPAPDPEKDQQGMTKRCWWAVVQSHVNDT